MRPNAKIIMGLFVFSNINNVDNLELMNEGTFSDKEDSASQNTAEKKAADEANFESSNNGRKMSQIAANWSS
ncbi:hypothetical protein TVAG_458940 [Trichomonas vaginalis G3]|uniref:Uncharacterized protein n=1 Tax=Trichomonas vaginalis (strain ATCC PRA-98 / G3) TaxID=412133 RepID=A2E699_TRIV3|nr:hypothetical protein TVAG_458940 [Trichomonas vaginalis G3]|eukprot:XP_001324045.1 hypothetical protein [Trichomonas vaginalis G3]